jgi:hypothetical protein
MIRFPASASRAALRSPRVARLAVKVGLQSLFALALLASILASAASARQKKDVVAKAGEKAGAADVKMGQVMGVTSTATDAVRRGEEAARQGGALLNKVWHRRKPAPREPAPQVSTPSPAEPQIRVEPPAETAAPQIVVAPGAMAPAIKPLMQCEDAQGAVGESIQLSCVVQNASGTPVAGATVYFSIQQNATWTVLGFVKTDADGAASMTYKIDHLFVGKATSVVLDFNAEIKAGNLKILPGRSEGHVFVRR